MRLNLTGRTLICLVSIPSDALSLDDLEEHLRPGRATTQVTNPDLVLSEYRDFRVLLSGGRLQVDFRPGGDRDLVRRASAFLLDAVERYRPTAVGFNGVLSVETTSGQDPAAPLVDVNAAANRLGTDIIRGGFKFVYSDQGARWTWGLEPKLDQEDAWVASVNRHYDEIPADEVRAEAIGWFAAVDQEMDRVVRALTSQDTANDHDAD